MLLQRTIGRSFDFAQDDNRVVGEIDISRTKASSLSC